MIAFAAGWQFRPDPHPRRPRGSAPPIATVTPTTAGGPALPRPLPVEIRGIHVTGALASLPGKLAEYAALRGQGLNTIVLDVKDEGGVVSFAPRGVPLAQTLGAVRADYDPRPSRRMLHARGIYLIGRIVVFQDPFLSRGRPALAVHRRDGSIWTTSAGLGWVDPYDRRVWAYDVGIAKAAAKAGFDEIMFDYVRFPSDGDVGGAVYPARSAEAPGRVSATSSRTRRPS